MLGHQKTQLSLLDDVDNRECEEELRNHIGSHNWDSGLGFSKIGSNFELR
jgi:hypothetical protein